MTLRLNLSPCPNDTFVFDALLNGRVDTGGIRFEAEFHDIERLNAILAAPGPDVSKCSYAVLPRIAPHYTLLESGGALGFGNGPLLVAARDFKREEFSSLSVAVPGINTTANMLMNRIFPQVVNKREVLFSDIPEAILGGEVEAGVLIHESRFTFRERGLRLLADLGAEWEALASLPLPLGAIVASRGLDARLRRKVERLIARSARYAMENPAASREFVKAHARELDDVVIDKHIAMFVNRYTVTLGDQGRRAAAELLGMDVQTLFA